DELVRSGDALQRPGLGNAKDQRIIEATGALEDGPAPAAPPQDPNLVGLADRKIGFHSRAVGLTDHHERLYWLPKSQQFALLTLLAEVQQGLVAGQVLRRGRKCKVNIFHCAKAVLIYSSGPSQLRTLSNAAILRYDMMVLGASDRRSKFKQPMSGNKVKLQKEQPKHSQTELRPHSAQPGRVGNGADIQDWFESLEPALEFVLKSQQPEKTARFLDKLVVRLRDQGIKIPHVVSTPYINTIPPEKQPAYQGDWETEVRIKSYIRWNAMAMVVNANRLHDGLGGHISTYASCATLYEVAFNHFFRGRTADFPGDIVYFQGHASPGVYARAFLERRLDEHHLQHFRQELAQGGGLSSYPHPYLMPNFWQFPTVSMGLGPIMSIYQARFNRYL